MTRSWRPCSRAAAVLGVALALATPRRALGWDSVCVFVGEMVNFTSDAGTPFCVPLAARTPASDFIFCNRGGFGSALGVFGGEHAFLTAKIFRDLGFDDYTETERKELPVWVENATFQHLGVAFDRLTPLPFSAPNVELRGTARPYTVSGFSELPDFAAALADWASGYEHCAIEHIARSTTDEVQRCHEFTEILGPGNSNHFVPQAREVFKHYHALAKEVLAECKSIQEKTRRWPYVENSRRLVDEVLDECEAEGLILEAIGLHYLQDVFSAGHMWERWARPQLERSDELTKAKMVAALAGVIHGWRTLVEPLLVNAGADPKSRAVGVIAQDPLGADAEYRAGASSDVRKGVGDDYVLPCLQSYVNPSRPALFLDATSGNFPDFEEQWRSMHRCTAAAVADAYNAGPKLKGELSSPDYMEGVDPRIHETAACYARRATNTSMYQALWLGFVPISPEQLANLEVQIFQVTLGGVEIALLALQDVAEWRNTLVTLNAAFYINQHVDSSGTTSAELLFPGSSVFGFSRNSIYHPSQAVPSHADPPSVANWTARPTATACDSDADCDATYVCNASVGQCELPEAATLRAFNRAHAGYWCSNLTLSRADLDALRTQCAGGGSAARCDLCVEIVRRHVRNSCDEPSWEALPREDRVDALCTVAALSTEIVYAGLREACAAPFSTPEDAARQWCETQDLSEILPPDPAARDSLEAVSPGGLEPTVRLGESVTLEVLYRDAMSRLTAGQLIRFAAYREDVLLTCQSPVDGETRITSPGGSATFVVTTNPQHEETIYVRACPTMDPTTPCNLCDPSTLTFTVRSRAGTFLRKVAGDDQVGNPGATLPVPLTVEVVREPPVADGTLIEFSTPDLGLPFEKRARFDGSPAFVIQKRTSGSRAEVRLTLPDADQVMVTTVRAKGVNTLIFPDPDATAVEFTARAQPRLGALRFGYFQGSPIGGMNVRIDARVDGAPIAARVVAVADDHVPVDVRDFAPENASVEVTLSGTNDYGVGFRSAPITVRPFQALVTNNLGSVKLLADRGHVIVRLQEGTSPPERQLLFFDHDVPWPPLGAAEGLPGTVSADSEASFNVDFQAFVTNAGAPKRRRFLDIYLYSPGNEGRAAEWPAIVDEDEYLEIIDGLPPLRASNPPPSQAYVLAHLAGDPGMTVRGVPFKVYDPDASLILEYPADWTGGPFWFPEPSTDRRIVTGGYDGGEGYVWFAANGEEFRVSPHGLLFVVVDPPLAGFVPGGQRQACIHDRGRVQRIRQSNPPSCATDQDCRPIARQSTGICMDGQCFDFNYPEIDSRDAYCSISTNPVALRRCSAAGDFDCGPGLRCVAEQCVP